MRDQAETVEPSGQGALTRRDFIGMAAVGGVLVAGACAPAGEPDASRLQITPSDLDEATVDDLRLAMESGERTSRSIVDHYLGRIADLDRAGPTLRSVIEVNPEALEIADRLDAEREGGTVRGPLHGIPVLLKDNIATADRMQTTAGSLALEGAIPAEDSFVARRLRDAGAVILGKANLSEWANFRSTRSSSGWSGRGGQCRNPYVLDRNPCGSSSGSGVAASANLTALAIGTETDGSIVCPSSANGIVGVKPTVGLVSRSRIVPISHSQDTAGPMARTVRDAALLLGAIAGVDSADPATEAGAQHVQGDYAASLDPGGLRGARIGVAREFFEMHEGVAALMEEAVAAMRDAGAIIIDPVEFPTRNDVGDPEFEVLLYEFKADLNAYLAGLGPNAQVRTMADVIAFNRTNADRELPYFGQELFEMSVEKGPLTEPAYRDALATGRRLARQDGIDGVMDAHNLDAVVAPTGGPAWTTDLLNGDRFLGGSSALAAVAGYPNINMPAGAIHGLPVGMSIFGRAWSEPTLLRIAYGFEQATNHRRPPEFLPSLDL